jgi:hypothetical protein
VSDRDSSPDFLVLQAAANRRRLKLVILGGVVVAVTIGVATLAVQRSARQELEAGIDDLRGCLLQAPLEAKETPALRFRRLQLQALTQPDSALAAERDKLWPFLCRPLALRVSESLKDSVGEEDRKTLDGLAAFLGNAGAIAQDPTPAVEPAVALLDKLHSSPVRTSASPLPPRGRTVDDLPKTSALSAKGTAMSSTFTEDNPGVSMPVLVDEPDMAAPVLCVFHASEPAGKCRLLTELAPTRGHGRRLLGTSDPDAPNLIFAGRRGSEGVFVAGSPVPVDRLYSYGGYAARDGAAYVLGWDDVEKNMVLSKRSSASVSERVPLKPNFRIGNLFYGSQLLWDQVLVRGVTPDNERRLFVLPLGKRADLKFDLVDIGELPEPGLIRAGEEEQPHLTGCRTERATVVRVRGSEKDYLTFRVGDHFSQPVFASPHGVLGCYGTSATIVRISHPTPGSLRLHHETCTSAGCRSTVLKGEALDRNTTELRPKDDADSAAVDLAGKLVVAWVAGDRGGLRVRVAEPDRFDRAPDTLVLDDHVADGKLCRDSTLLGFRLYSREKFAVLLVSTMAGVHAFRIDVDGSVKPWPVAVAG